MKYYVNYEIEANNETINSHVILAANNDEDVQKVFDTVCEKMFGSYKLKKLSLRKM